MAIEDSYVSPTLLGFQKVFNFWRSILYWSCWQKVECKFSRHDSWRSLFEDCKRLFRTTYIDTAAAASNIVRGGGGDISAHWPHQISHAWGLAHWLDVHAHFIYRLYHSDSCCDVYCDVVTGLQKEHYTLKIYWWRWHITKLKSSHSWLGCLWKQTSSRSIYSITCAGSTKPQILCFGFCVMIIIRRAIWHQLS